MKMNLKESLGFTALSLPCVLLCLLAGWKTNPPTAAKLQRLQGYWEGELLGGSFKCSIAFTGNALHFYSRPDFWYKATFTLPAGTDPQQLSATIKDTAASATNDIGKVIVAIFKIKDGTLTLAVNQDPAGPPPKAFPSETNSVIARYDLKKAQPQKKTAEASGETVDWSDRILHVQKQREKRGIMPWTPILNEMEALLRDMQKRATSYLLFPSPFNPEKLICRTGYGS